MKPAWSAARIDPATVKLWKGVTFAGYVSLRSQGKGAGLWYVHAAIPGRKGSRIGRPTARAAAWLYFGPDAGWAVEAVEEKPIS